jgi:hypothetical protein
MPCSDKRRILAETGHAPPICKREKGFLVRFIQSIAIAFFLVFTAAFCGGRAHAQVPGPHPAYLHALSDLRLARAYLNELGSNARTDIHEQTAITEIDDAIAQIKHASIDDGKDLNDHPPVDAHIDRPGRFHAAEKLLHHVHDDLSHAEDVPQSRDLRNHALLHVDKAWKAVQEAMNTNR